MSNKRTLGMFMIMTTNFDMSVDTVASQRQRQITTHRKNVYRSITNKNIAMLFHLKSDCRQLSCAYACACECGFCLVYYIIIWRLMSAHGSYYYVYPVYAWSGLRVLTTKFYTGNSIISFKWKILRYHTITFYLLNFISHRRQ